MVQAPVVQNRVRFLKRSGKHKKGDTLYVSYGYGMMLVGQGYAEWVSEEPRSTRIEAAAFDVPEKAVRPRARRKTAPKRRKTATKKKDE